MLRIIQLTTDNREHSKNYAAPAPYFGAAPEALLDGFAGLPGAEVHVVSCVRQPVASPSKLAENIHYHSLVVPKIGWMRTLYLGCIRSVRTLLGEIGPDIVHGQGTERDCAISAVHSGFPNVVTIHGNMAEIQRLNLHGHPWFGRAASLLETHTLKRTSGVFCNSAYTKELVSPRAKRTWLVPNAIRSSFFRPSSQIHGRNAVPQLLNVGLVSERKRQLEVLNVVRELAEEGHGIKIVFAGNLAEHTPYGRRFVEELKRGEEAGYAAYAGFLDAGSLIDLMDGSEGFVHFPSEEAFGLVVAEAMARGLKFFGADLGGIRDICDDVPGPELSQNFSELKSSISRWLDAGAGRSPESAVVMAERYRPEVVAAQHMKIYHDVLSSSVS